MSFSWQMGQQSVVSPYDRLLLSNEGQHSTDTHCYTDMLQNMLSERGQPQSAMIPFVWNAQNRQIRRDRVD